MSGNRKCTKCRKVTIPGGDRMCQPCELNSMIDQITTMNVPEITPDFSAVCKSVMETHKGTLQKLAADEANEWKAKASPSSGSAHELPAYLAQQGTKSNPDYRNLTLSTDSAMRKDVPLLRGCLRYFPAALMGVAQVSKRGNDKHNPGEEMYHARGKSMDHGDCILRHLVDVQDLLTAYTRAPTLGASVSLQSQILEEASQLAWRALALSQELHERFGAPLAPGARLE